MEAQENLVHAYWFVGNDDRAIESAIQSIATRAEIAKEDIVTLGREDEESIGKKAEIKSESVRKWIKDMNLSPLNGRARLGIIYGCERLNINSANILLKTLEEPPANAVCILVSATNSLLPTVASRCRKSSFFTEIKPCVANYSKLLDQSIDLALTFKEIERIVKENETSNCLAELETVFRRDVVEKQDLDSVELLLQLEEGRANIANNANPRLVLENIILAARTLE